MKHKELVEANRKVVELICKKLLQEGIIGKDAGVCEDHMKLCLMKIFSKLTNPQLEAFILAHNATITSKSQLSSKGSLKEAEDNTVRNRIQFVFDCRESPNKMKGVLSFDVFINLSNEVAENYFVHLITLTKDKTIQPSSLLGNIVWVKFVINFLNLERTAAITSKVSDSDKEKADLLLIKLCEHFKSHVKEWVKQAAKQKSLDLEVCIQELTCYCSNDGALEPPQAEAQVSEQNSMFVWLATPTSLFLVRHFQGWRERTYTLISIGVCL
jgi:hypothetical protein